MFAPDEVVGRGVAVPVPEPAPVAVKDNPTVFDVAPIAVKSVVPTVVIP